MAEREDRDLSDERIWLEGDELVNVAGESHYQAALQAISGAKRGAEVRHEVLAVLRPDPENPHDSNAVRVEIDGELVGFLSRSDAIAYQPLTEKLLSAGKVGRCDAMIAGRGDGESSMLGVFLRLPPPEGPF